MITWWCYKTILRSNCFNLVWKNYVVRLVVNQGFSFLAIAALKILLIRMYQFRWFQPLSNIAFLFLSFLAKLSFHTQFIIGIRSVSCNSPKPIYLRVSSSTNNSLLFAFCHFTHTMTIQHMYKVGVSNPYYLLVSFVSLSLSANDFPFISFHESFSISRTYS